MNEYYHFLTKKIFFCFLISIMQSLSSVKFPNYYIYRSQKFLSLNNIREVAKIISIKDGQVKGEMEFRPSYVNRKAKGGEPSLFIDFLVIHDRKKGYGTKLLNYAKKCSEQMGCEGNFWLDSSTCFLPQEIPHTFYRKFGMTSDNIKTDKMLDKFILKGKIPTYKDMGDVFMYYPNYNQKKVNIFKKLWNKLFF